MTFKKAICIFLVIFFGLSSLSYAQGPMTKLGRGAANVLTGWIEIPKEIVTVTEDEGDIRGLFVAPLTGLWKALVRTTAGVYEVLTFVIPVPADYEAVVYPESVISSD